MPDQEESEKLGLSSQGQREGEDEITDVVRVNKLSQLSFGLLRKLKGLPKVSHAKVWHHDDVATGYSVNK